MLRFLTVLFVVVAVAQANVLRDGFEQDDEILGDGFEQTDEILQDAIALLPKDIDWSSDDSVLIPQLPDGRIVGGTAAAISRFPYQLSLRRSNSHFCGAAIISRNWALSAAHCTIGQSASQLTVRAGSANRSSGGSLHQVSRIINHPSYNTRTLDFDISLISVSSPFNFGSTINAIALPSSGQAVNAGVYAVVSGWGTLVEGGSSLPTQLQQVAVPIVLQSTCNSLYRGGITNSMLCAGYLAGGRDACQGDSGGPLVSNNRLVGIVSWGSGCARRNAPGVYARVAAVRNWIQSNTGV